MPESHYLRNFIIMSTSDARVHAVDLEYWAAKFVVATGYNFGVNHEEENPLYRARLLRAC